MMHLEKLDACPECGTTLTQVGYDAQACACGWGPFGVPSEPKPRTDGRPSDAAIAKAFWRHVDLDPDFLNRLHRWHVAARQVIAEAVEADKP
jgi:hypothetical protein